jgi:hypothetical protein
VTGPRGHARGGGLGLGALAAIYWCGLALWVSAIASAAVAAMSVFPTLDAFGIWLDAYPAYPGEEHGRLLAGHIMDGVFRTADRMQAVAACLVVLPLMWQLVSRRVPQRPIANGLRAVAVGLTVSILAVHLFVLAPRMNDHLNAFRSAARAGDAAAAASERAAFNELHPVADGLLRANLGLILVTIVASAFALRPETRP